MVVNSGPRARTPPASPSSAVDLDAAERALHHLGVLEHLGFFPTPADVASGDERRGAILATGLTLFASRGYEACTLRDLAAATGVKTPTIYGFFRSKEDIFASVVRYALSDFFGFVLRPLAEEPAGKRLEGLVRRHTDYRLEHAHVAWATDTLMLGDRTARVLSSDRHRQVVTAARAYVNIVRDLISAQAPPGGDIDDIVIAFSIIAICDRVSSWFRLDAALSASAIREEVWRLAQRLIGGRDSESVGDISGDTLPRIRRPRFDPRSRERT